MQGFLECERQGKFESKFAIARSEAPLQLIILENYFSSDVRPLESRREGSYSYAEGMYENDVPYEYKSQNKLYNKVPYFTSTAERESFPNVHVCVNC